jgi:hypothetical protein
VTAPPLPRDATRVRLVIDPVAGHVVQAALELGIRRAVGDPKAVIGYYSAASGEDGEDLVITVRQAHGSWWAMMPAGFAEAIGGYTGTTTIRWRDSEPPKAVDD